MVALATTIKDISTFIASSVGNHWADSRSPLTEVMANVQYPSTHWLYRVGSWDFSLTVPLGWNEAPPQPSQLIQALLALHSEYIWLPIYPKRVRLCYSMGKTPQLITRCQKSPCIPTWNGSKDSYSLCDKASPRCFLSCHTLPFYTSPHESSSWARISCDR